MDKSQIKVSVIIPVFNEERHIEKCIASINRQDYPREHIEYIFVDGNSTDLTRKLLDDYAKGCSFIRVLNNPDRTAPYAMNLGIRHASGEYIVRLDGHSEYAEDYISKCIEYLSKTGADNVGGIAVAKSSGYFGNAIACVLSSVFGVGNSSFRTSSTEGYVETVPFGAFKKEVFEKYGLYDVRLTRNQDIELNRRIIKNGGKIFMTPEIRVNYLNRDRLSGFMKQGYSNGLWNIITWFLCPGALSVRHFVPFLFVASIIFLPLLFILTGLSFFKWLFLSEMILYFALDFLFSIRSSYQKGIKYLPVLPFLFLMLHVSYGFGSFVGIGKSIRMINGKAGRSTIDV